MWLCCWKQELKLIDWQLTIVVVAVVGAAVVVERLLWPMLHQLHQSTTMILAVPNQEFVPNINKVINKIAETNVECGNKLL